MGLHVLGPLELTAGDRSLKIGGPREHVVLAMLALRVHRVTSFDQLMEAVWGESPPSTARGQIQSSISALRKLFADAGLPDAIATHPSGYLLRLSDRDLDSERFSKLVATANRQVVDGRTAESAATLSTAVNLWRGRALDGVPSDLVQRAASVLDDALMTATMERLRLDLELGRHEEIIGELQTLLTEHPWREPLYAFLMLALYRSGRQADALEVGRRARNTLVTDVGIEPGQELRDLERAMLNRDPSLDLPPADSGRPGIADPQAVNPRQLPGSIADFVGREDHIADIKRILSGGQDPGTARYAVPIIAISGGAGVGKSTLALRVAHELGEEFPDGHIYADLRGSPQENPTSALLARFLRALGVSGSVIPEELAERIEMYRSRLANKRLLLVLDDVASEEQVLPLLPGSPSCAVIVTSRARLVGMPGAAWIDIDRFDDETSTKLLAKIAGWGRLQAEPDAAVELVTYCGGLPLALRIAGARLASRPRWRVAELARRLKSEVRRLDELSHRGLEVRSSIELTYRSLPEQAQRLLRLSAMIKAPGCPGWIAAALLDTDLRRAEDILELLVDAQMLDTQLCPAGRVRYSFHDLIRVYAQERLMDSETPEARDSALGRMLGGWLALAERAHRKEYGGDFTILHGTAPRLHLAEWDEDDPIGYPLDWLEHERVGLVSAVRQAAGAGMDELCWDLALTSVSLFEVKGYMDDWRETAELAHAAAVTVGNQVGIAAMLYSLGTLHMVQKRLVEAERLFVSALEIFESEGDLHGQGLVLRNSAFIDRMRANVESMLAKYNSALAKMRAVGDLIGEAHILASLGKFRIDEGDFDEAHDMLSEALSLCKRANYQRGETHVTNSLAELYLSTGQIMLARRAMNDVLRTVRETGDRIGEAHALYGLGVIRRREGRMDSAEATLAHALSVAERVGERLIEGQAHYALAEIAVARADNTTAGTHIDKAKAVFDELGLSLWLAKTLILLSEVRDYGGEADLAKADLEQARDLLTGIGSKQSARLLQQLQEASSALVADALSGRRWP